MLSGDFTLMLMFFSGLLKIRVKDVNILGLLRLHTCITPFLLHDFHLERHWWCSVLLTRCVCTPRHGLCLRPVRASQWKWGSFLGKHLKLSQTTYTLCRYTSYHFWGFRKKQDVLHIKFLAMVNYKIVFFWLCCWSSYTVLWQAWAHQESLLASKSSIDRARKLYQLCVEVNPESVHSWQVFVFTPYICKFFKC